MLISFHKYQSTGNDFVLIDNRALKFPKTDKSFIQKLCDRRLGIGADGLILLEDSEKHDFVMVYYNADGGLGSFCGNGSRAIVGFAHSLGIISTHCSFEAYDGIHDAIIDNNLIRIKMGDVQNGRELLNGTFIDTGSPHYLEVVNDLDKMDVKELGRELRNKEEFMPNGVNINFIEKLGDHQIKVRTYERGVEDETLSCGTGVTAAAIVATKNGMGNNIQIHTLGGDLRVSLETVADSFENIWLEGPTERVFSGELMI
jgi:diaminopimelate epimerase